MDNSFWKSGSTQDALKNWPLDESGEKIRAALLMQTFDSPADTDMVISLLSAYEIPCFKYYDLDGGAGKIINGFSGYGASLYVPATLLSTARDILSAQVQDEDMREENT